MSEYLPVKIDGTTELFLERATLSELIESRDQLKGIARAHGVDEAWASVTGNHGVTFNGLGSDPGHAALMREVRGWFAIAVRAVAQRVQKLTRTHLEVALVTRSSDGALEEQLIHDHPVNRLLEKPNDEYTMAQLTWIITWQLKQIGESYLIKVRDGLGLVTELWPEDPRNVSRLNVRGSKRLWGYRIMLESGMWHDLPKTEVIRFWNPDPSAITTALGVLGPSAITADIMQFVGETWRYHFEHNAIPQTVMTSDENAQEWEPEVKKEFKADWRNRYNRRRGTDEGIPAMLPLGWTITELQGPGDNQSVTTLTDQGREEIMMAVGTPPSLVGKVDDVNRAAADANIYVFDLHTVSAITDLISDTLTREIAFEYDPERHRLNIRYREFVERDKEFILAQEKQDLELMVRSIQQVRTDRKLDPDDAPWGEFPVGQFGLAPYKGEDFEDQQERAVDLDDPDDRKRAEFIAEHQPQIDAAAALIREAQGQSKWVARQRLEGVASRSIAEVQDPDLWWARVHKAEREHLGRFTRNVHRAFVKQRQQVESALKHPSMKKAFPNTLRDGDGDPVTRKQLRELLKELLPAEEWARIFRAEVDPYRQEIFVDEAGHSFTEFKKATGSEVEQYEVSKAAAARLRREGIILSGVTSKTSLSRVVNHLAKGIAAGEDPAKIMKRLEPTFGRGRARTISRTEVHGVTQMAQSDGWAQTNALKAEVWNDARDKDVRDSHRIHGQKKEPGGKFKLRSGRTCEAPGDGVLPPEDRVNCRCFATPLAKGKA